MTITYEWHGHITSAEVNVLHAEAFETRVFTDAEWDWADLVRRHSLGWATARDLDRGGVLVGFVNVPWDGLVHAWIQDTMVAADVARQGIATRLIEIAKDGARQAGCEWLHVDFDDHLRPLYFGACGFTPTNAGLIALQADPG